MDIGIMLSPDVGETPVADLKHLGRFADSDLHLSHHNVWINFHLWKPADRKRAIDYYEALQVATAEALKQIRNLPFETPGGGA